MCRVVKTATCSCLVRNLRKLTSLSVLIYIFYGLVPNLARGQSWSVFLPSYFAMYFYINLNLFIYVDNLFYIAVNNRDYIAFDFM
jgi:hypothetical protein